MNTPVNYPIAKLLKEKGYDKPCGLLYDNNGVLSGTKMSMGGNPNSYTNKYSAPTIAEVVMWLYEKHGVWIQVTVNDMWVGNRKSYTAKFNSEVISQNRNFKVRSLTCTKMRIEPYDCPIEAYEVAIEYVLTNLI